MLWTAPPLEPGHKIYPYLLRGEAVTPPNQVWAIAELSGEQGIVWEIQNPKLKDIYKLEWLW
jgi:hypothetical protein